MFSRFVKINRMSMNETEIQKRARDLGKEPAFPTSSLETAFGYTGLTKREWLASQLIASFKYESYVTAAQGAIKQADALLIALAESEVTNG